MRRILKYCSRLLAAIFMGALTTTVAGAFTLSELAEHFPKNNKEHDKILLFSVDNVEIVALADYKDRVGIVLLLPRKAAEREAAAEVGTKLLKLFPEEDGRFLQEEFSCRGKIGQALVNDTLLASNRSQRNHWLGIPLYDCLCYALSTAKGRIVAVSEDSITVEIPHSQYGRVKVSIYLMNLDEIELVDAVPRKKSRKTAEFAATLSEEFDFYYNSEVSTEDARDIKRDYLISRPLVYGRFYMGTYSKTLPSYVSIEGNAFRIGTARAFKILRSSKDLDPLAFNGGDSPIPETWHTTKLADSGSPSASADKPTTPGDTPAPQPSDRKSGTGSSEGKAAMASSTNTPASEEPAPAAASTPASAPTETTLTPEAARSAYMDALRKL